MHERAAALTTHPAGAGRGTHVFQSVREWTHTPACNNSAQHKPAMRRPRSFWAVLHVLLPTTTAATVPAAWLATSVTCEPASEAPTTALVITVALPFWNASAAPPPQLLQGGIQITRRPASAVGTLIPREPRWHVMLATGVGGPTNTTSGLSPGGNVTAGALACQALCDADATCAAWNYNSTAAPSASSGSKARSLAAAAAAAAVAAAAAHDDTFGASHGAVVHRPGSGDGGDGSNNRHDDDDDQDDDDYMDECSLYSAVGCPVWAPPSTTPSVRTHASAAKADLAACSAPVSDEQSANTGAVATMLHGPVTLAPSLPAPPDGGGGDGGRNGGGSGSDTGGVFVTALLVDLQPGTEYSVTAKASDHLDYMSLLGWGPESPAANCTTESVHRYHHAMIDSGGSSNGDGDRRLITTATSDNQAQRRQSAASGGVTAAGAGDAGDAGDRATAAAEDGGGVVIKKKATTQSRAALAGGSGGVHDNTTTRFLYVYRMTEDECAVLSSRTEPGAFAQVRSSNSRNTNDIKNKSSKNYSSGSSSRSSRSNSSSAAAAITPAPRPLGRPPPPHSNNHNSTTSITLSDASCANRFLFAGPSAHST